MSIFLQETDFTFQMNPSMDGSLQSSYSDIDYSALPGNILIQIESLRYFFISETSSTEGQNCVEHVTMQGQVMHLPIPTSPECGYFPSKHSEFKISTLETNFI